MASNVDLSDVCVVIPTQNEKENIQELIERIQRKRVGRIVIADASLDGTDRIVEELANKYRDITLYKRQTREFGLGIRRGLEFAIKNSPSSRCFITMDADISQNPDDLSALRFALETEDGPDIAVGSRYVEGGRIIGWNMRRKATSHVANFLATFVLGIPVKDSTINFRCYRRECLEAVLHDLTCTGYDVEIELLRRADRKGFRIIEVPITFANRRRGKSKLATGEIMRFIKTIIRLRFASS